MGGGTYDGPGQDGRRRGEQDDKPDSDRELDAQRVRLSREAYGDHIAANQATLEHVDPLDPVDPLDGGPHTPTHRTIEDIEAGAAKSNADQLADDVGHHVRISLVVGIDPDHRTRSCRRQVTRELTMRGTPAEIRTHACKVMIELVDHMLDGEPKRG